MSEKWLQGLTTLCTIRCAPEKTGLNWSIYLSPDELLNAAHRLDREEYFIEDVSVVDTAEGFLVNSHFSHFDRADRVCLRVLVPHHNPKVPSLAGIFTGADWHERECTDFFGIIFTGHPNLIPLLMTDDMKDHPLVKASTARAQLKDVTARGEIVSCDPAFAPLVTPAPEKPEAKKAD